MADHMSQYVGMVKGQGRGILEIEPAYLVRVAAGLQMPASRAILAQHSKVHDADRPATRIAARIAKGVQLLKVDRFRGGFLL